MQTADVAAVIERWNDNQHGSDAFSEQVFWLAIPEVNARYQRLAAGGRDAGTWACYLARTFLGERASSTAAASLGCGAGVLERELHALRAFRTCDAFDIAPAAIETARLEASRAHIDGIHYEVRDLQRVGLPQRRYDAVWCNATLHHIESLEFVLDEVRRVLEPDGWLFVNDYVGPDRFAFTARQQECMLHLHSLLPARLRRSCMPGDRGRIRESVDFPDPRAVAREDPSEAIRSSAILPAIAERFDIVVQRNCGGTLLHWLLAGIAGNFRPGDADAMRYLDMLFAVEATLIDQGDLASDFVVLAARPKARA